MSLLDDLNITKLIADTAGALLFSDIRIFRTANAVSDGRGGYNRGREIVSAKGIITEYSEFMRQVGGVPLDARKLIIQGEGLATAPIPEDLVELELQGWIIQKVTAVPSQAVFECQVVPTDLSLAEGLAALSVTAAITAADATLNGSITLSGLAIGVSMNAQAADAWGSMVVVNPIKASVNQAGADATLSASIVNPIGISAGLWAANATMSSSLVGPITAQLGLQAADAVLSARIGSGNFVNLVATAADATITASLDNPIDVSGNNQADDAVLVASATNPIGISLAANVDNATLAASIFVPNDVVSVSNAADATLSANVTLPLTSSLAASAADATLSAALNNPAGISMSITAGDATITAGTNNPVKASASIAAADATLSADVSLTSSGPNLGEPTLAAGVQMAYDPAGTIGGTYTDGLAPHSAAPYQGPLWPVAGSDDTVDAAYNGVLDATGASALVLDKSDLDAAGVNGASQARTISFWMKLGVSTGTHYREIFGQGINWVSSSGSVDGDYGVRVDNTILRGGFNGSFNTQRTLETGKENFLDGTWHHVCIAMNDTEKAFFFDGSESTNTSTGAGWEMTDAQAAMVWACNDAIAGQLDHTGAFSATSDFDVEIGDIRIYNEKISDADALALHAAGRYEYDAGAAPAGFKYGMTDDMVALWPLDADLTDGIGSNDFTIVAGTPTYNATGGPGADKPSLSGDDTFVAEVEDNAEIGYSGDFTSFIFYKGTVNEQLMAKGESAFGEGEWMLSIQFIDSLRVARASFNRDAGGSLNLDDTGNHIGDGVDWHLIAARYRARDRFCELIVDGVVKATGTLVSDMGRDTTANGLFIGSGLGGVGGLSPSNEIALPGLVKQRMPDEKLAWLFNSGNGRTAAEVIAEVNATAFSHGETWSKINALSTKPAADRLLAYDKLFDPLVASGAIDQLDWLSAIGADDYLSRANLIDSTEALVDFGTPTIVFDQYYDQANGVETDGFQGHASVTGEGASLGDFCFGAYWLKKDENGASRDIRIGDNETFIRTDFGAPISRLTGVTTTNGQNLGVNDPFSIILSHVDTTATGRRLFINGALEDSVDGSGGTLSGSAQFGADNNAADSHHGAYWSGRGLTDAQALSLHNGVNAYLTEIGVIAAAPPSLVQEKSDVGDANPITLPLAATPTAGNLLIVVAGARQSTGDNTITDTGSNTGWTQHFREETYEGDTSHRRLLTAWSKVSDGTEASITVDYGSNAVEGLVMEINISGRTPTFGAVNIDDGGTAPAALSTTRSGLTAGDRVMIACGVIRGDPGAADFDGNYAGQGIDVSETDTDCHLAAAWHYKTDTADETVILSNPALTERGAMALFDFVLS